MNKEDIKLILREKVPHWKVLTVTALLDEMAKHCSLGRDQTQAIIHEIVMDENDLCLVSSSARTELS